MLEWTAEASGTYTIVVGGFGGGTFGLVAGLGRGSRRKELTLSPLSAADSQTKFGYNTSIGDEEESDDDEDSWLSDDDEVLDFQDNAIWGFDI